MIRYLVLIVCLFFFSGAATAQQTSGGFSEGSIKIGYDSSTCNAGLAGAMRYNGFEDIKTGLTAYFNFDESAGTTAADSSGNGYDGTLIANPTWSASGGKIGGALNLDGSQDAVLVPSAGLPTGDFTVAAWIKPTDLINRRLWWIYNDAGQAAQTYQKWTNEWDSETTIVNTSPPANLNGVSGYLGNSTWQHYALTRSGSAITLYRNGVSIATHTDATALHTGVCDFAIGGALDCTGDTAASQVWLGLIDEFRTYNRALSAAEINALPGMTTDIASNLTAHWKLDESSGTVANDELAATDGDVVGAPPWLPTGGKDGGALDFDGTSDYVEFGSPERANLQLTGDVTIATWVKTSTNDANERRIFWETDNWNQKNFDLRILSGKVKFGHGNNITEDTYVGNTFIADGAWHHVAFVADYPNGYLYVDGALDKAVTMAFDVQIHDTANNYRINGNGASTYLAATIDDMRIYDRALTAGDINALPGVGGEVQFCNGSAWTGWGE